MSSQQTIAPTPTKPMTHSPTKQHTPTKQDTQKSVQQTPTKLMTQSHQTTPKQTTQTQTIAPTPTKPMTQTKLNSQQVFVEQHLDKFLDFFVLVKYVVLYYTYGILNKDKYDSSYHTFKTLLDKVKQRKTYDLKSYMKDDNPLTIVTLDEEMMNFILNEMNKDFASSIQTFKRQTLLSIHSDHNYKTFKNHPGNKDILETLKKYYNTFCWHPVNVNSVVSVDKIKEMLTGNIQDFGNKIAKDIMDHKKDKAMTGPKPQTEHMTSMEKLKKQVHEITERLMKLVHPQHNKENNSNLQ